MKYQQVMVTRRKAHGMNLAEARTLSAKAEWEEAEAEEKPDEGIQEKGVGTGYIYRVMPAF